MNAALAMSICFASLLTAGSLAQSEKPAGKAGDQAIDVSELPPEHESRIVDHVAEHGRDPVEYLVSCFDRHDVVLLGETHQIRENCEFVQDVLGPLYVEAGVRALVTEFVPSRLNDQLRTLVTAETFDEDLAVQIQRENAWPTWGFREYLDIYRAAWKVNSELAEGSEPLLVVGMDSDWSQYDLWFGSGDRRARMMSLLERERHMTRVVTETAFDSGHKTLVHVGRAHTFNHGERLGTQLERGHPGRTYQVALHFEFPFRKQRSGLTTLLERAFAANGNQPVGLKIEGSPLASLRDKACPYWQGDPDSGLGRWVQGYVFLAPLAEQNAVRWIEGFVDEEHLEKALAVAERAGFVKKGAATSAAELDQLLAMRFSQEKPY